MLVSDTIERTAAREPQRVACVSGSESVTYSQLRDEVLAAARFFNRVGRPGDRIALLGESCVRFVVAYCAVPLAGRICTFINHRLQRNEVLELLADAGVVAVLADRRYADVLAGTERLRGYYYDDGAAPWTTAGASDAAEDRTARPCPDDVAWTIYTSGTTGRAKAVELTHRNITTGLLNSVLGYRFERDDVLVFPFPLDHVSAITPLALMLVGAKVVLLDRFDAARLVDLLATHEATVTTVAPTMLVRVLDHLDDRPVPLPSLRLLMYGSAPMPPVLLERTTAVFGPILAQGYGMTEASTNIAVLTPADHEELRRGRGAVGTVVGRPLPLIDVRVVDDAGRPVGRNVSGEIALRGDQVCGRYRGVDTDVSHPNGWLRTGDLGLIDDEGLLHIVGRHKDVINTGGEKVHPPEVEAVLLRHAEVREVAVLGVPDPLWGERVCALVVLTGDVGGDELAAHCARFLSPYKRPKQIVPVSGLPKTSTGKINKGLLSSLVPSDPDAVA